MAQVRLSGPYWGREAEHGGVALAKTGDVVETFGEDSERWFFKDNDGLTYWISKVPGAGYAGELVA